MLKEVNKITFNGIGFFFAFVVLEVLVIIGFVMAVGARDGVMVAVTAEAVFICHGGSNYRK